MVWADARLGEFGPTNQKIGFSRRRPIPAPEVYLSPAAGPGGQKITVQGHGFQPEMDVFLQMGQTTVASARTNAEGRVTAEVFVPISGEGAHTVQLVDDSGNVASTSFYMEFGFDNLQDSLDAQEETQLQVKNLGDAIAGLKTEPPAAADPQLLQRIEEDLQGLRGLETEVQQLRALLEREPEPTESPTPSPTPPPAEPERSRPIWPFALVGLVVLVVGSSVAIFWATRQEELEELEELEEG